mmetsp:Transcript_22504/g.49702  ORF Transcript_22504/g.49702 Transcript_22504/m.49702 type:complete len:348 (+) Transcript_22504:63-1106(+)
MGGVCCSPTAVEDQSRSEAAPAVKRLQQDTHMSDEDDRQRMNKVQGGGRRAGVAAESMNHDLVKDYQKPVYPKEAAAEDLILKTIKTNEKMQVLFGDLDAGTIKDVINAFQEASGIQGQDIILQGEEGDKLYIIEEGMVDVFVARGGEQGRGNKVASLGPGALFGELALMYSSPRAATVVIASPKCKLWSLDREPFKMLLAQKSQTTYMNYEEWLSQVEILKSLNHYELSRLSEAMTSTLYDDGEVIIQEGEPGDKFYILEDGSCAAYMSGPEGEKMVKEYKQKGDHFGEIALLTDAPRKATIRATDEGCAVISISKDDFTELLGPIKDLLQGDLGKYPQYAQFLGK